MKRLFYVLMVTTVLIGCKFDYLNPVDPASAAYQGYPVEIDPDNVQLSESKEADWMSFSASEIKGAEAYHLQVSIDENFDDKLIDIDSFSDRIMTPVADFVGGTDYYWRVRVKKDGEWGGWSRSASIYAKSMMSSLTPADGAGSADTTPTFSWSGPEEAMSYEFQSAVNEAELSTSDIVLLDTPYYAPEIAFENNQSHIWRVRAVKQSGEITAWSIPRMFNISWGAITGQHPAQGTFTPETTPQFSWDALSNVLTYEFQIAEDAALIDGAPVIELHDNEYIPASPLANNNYYYWRVRGKNNDGVYSEWSSVLSLRVEWGDVFGFSPSDNSTILDSEPVLSWDPVMDVNYYEVQYAFSSSEVEEAPITTVSGESFSTGNVFGDFEHLYWRVRAVKTDGTVGAWSVINDFEVRVLSYGDTFLGGYVFYLDGAGGGMIASTEDLSATWGGYGTLVGATSTAVGEGMNNTIAIYTEYGDNEPYKNFTNYLAKTIYFLSQNGYSDWYMPSRDELNLMYENLHLNGYGGFASLSYASSSETSSTEIYSQSFNSGNIYPNGLKNAGAIARPIRYFDLGNY